MNLYLLYQLYLFVECVKIEMLVQDKQIEHTHTHTPWGKVSTYLVKWTANAFSRSTASIYLSNSGGALGSVWEVKQLFSCTFYLALMIRFFCGVRMH